jgi:predicted GH43/DUF377 family glycosyl hydrolase
MSDVTFPYALRRAGVVMSRAPGDALEIEGVLNPATGRGPDGDLYLLPRLVAAGNVSRVGLARVIITDGVPSGVERLGVVLEPERSWERADDHSGVEDPRITWIEALGVHVMTYVAYGPLGPRTAVATSVDLRTWRRLGPVSYAYDDELGQDLNLRQNKDTTFFPEPVVAPDGRLSLAVLHRPMGLLGQTNSGGHPAPLWGAETRESIWIGFTDLAAAQRDLGALTSWDQNRFVAGPEFDFEALKIGGGPPPVRVPEGWLVLHHGVTGHLEPGVDQQQSVRYVAGGMILDAEEPWRLRQRSTQPLLEPETADEVTGIVPNVIFPTAIEEIEGSLFVFYGMADTSIGVAQIVPR